MNPGGVVGGITTEAEAPVEVVPMVDGALCNNCTLFDPRQFVAGNTYLNVAVLVSGTAPTGVAGPELIPTDVGLRTGQTGFRMSS